MAFQRRGVLQMLASGSLLATSGCLSRGASGGRSTTTPATSCETAGTRRVTLAETASVPTDVELSLTATMDRERVTPEAPARLRVTLTNHGQSVETKIADEQWCHLFNRRGGRSTPDGLWLYRREDAPSDTKGDCWTPQKAASETRTYVSIGCGRRSLAAGESVTTTYEVWDDYVAAGYYPPGDYRFRVHIPIWRATNGDEATEHHHPDKELDWWLELRVTENDP